jgi:hypothetical protein
MTGDDPGEHVAQVGFRIDVDSHEMINGTSYLSWLEYSDSREAS